MKWIYVWIGCAAILLTAGVWIYRESNSDRLARQPERSVPSGDTTELILHGKMVFADGRPAAGLSYGYVSKNYTPILEPKDFRITGPQGEFSVENPLPDELFSVWVFPRENTLCVWKRLGPDCKKLHFILKESEYIELPCDWLAAGFTHLAIAQDMVCVPGSKIYFALPELNGNLVSLEDPAFQNKAILVNLWGSWCGGCLMEIPWLVTFKNTYGPEGLEIIGIAFEEGSPDEQIAAVQKVAEKRKVNYPLLIGGSRDKSVPPAVIQGLEHFGGYPTTIYIDRSGVVRHIHSGFWILTKPHKEWQLKRMEDHIRLILGLEPENP